jgi:hypothetical protein
MMMSKPLILNDRAVVDIEVDGVDSRDYPDFCDAYFCSAFYEDSGEALSDDDLVLLQELFPEVLWDKCFDKLH